MQISLASSGGTNGLALTGGSGAQTLAGQCSRCKSIKIEPANNKKDYLALDVEAEEGKLLE